MEPVILLYFYFVLNLDLFSGNHSHFCCCNWGWAAVLVFQFPGTRLVADKFCTFVVAMMLTGC